MLTKNHADDNLSRSRHVRDPEMCVDYLSYRFDEMDLAASWRVMTKQKKEVVNGIRLENASWRTWAKHKYNLKTVSPETLNWLKDSDVTWLYGPLHTVIKNIDEEDRYAQPKISKTEDTLGLMTRTTRGQPQSPRPEQPPLKSALKKVTTSDLLRRSAIELPNLVNDTPAAKASAPKATMIDDDEEEESASATTTTSSSNMSLTEANKKLKVFSPSIVATHRQPKLRFNQYVEQCVALSTGEPSSSSSSFIQKPGRRARFENMDDEDDDHEEGDDDDNHSYLYTEDDDDSNHLSQSAVPRSSIKKIAPTRLKTSSQSEQETDDVSSLSSSSSSFRAEHNHRWTIDHANDDHDEDDGSSSSENEEIEIRSRQHHTGTSPPQAIQWVGQSCVYNHQPPIDYDEEDDYGFDDDDDWDTHDEEDNHISSSPTTATSPPTMNHFLSPPGQQGFGKALPVSEPCTIDATEPSMSRSTSQHSSTVVDMHRNMDQRSTGTTNNASSSSSSSNIFTNFTQWASSYLWSKPSSSSRQQ
ncbi:hypothetical protein O0I10_006961 [Lichtheimia ornata]|uniref:Nitrogen regulatory protein areA GATA-like domain-containing protein n=1 Tax=Lichtheimia ornata TaxID=688661 RepID=A0AAD7V386_9FUNG|nr:uncharacterized protein O0I10_006961 [Lichtheimia ornata]KAJ8657405.1 hypothetical protein O0I10_006961 [Lichtheimia ornata]